MSLIDAALDEDLGEKIISYGWIVPLVALMIFAATVYMQAPCEKSLTGDFSKGDDIYVNQVDITDPDNLRFRVVNEANNTTTITNILLEQQNAERTSMYTEDVQLEQGSEGYLVLSDETFRSAEECSQFSLEIRYKVHQSGEDIKKSAEGVLTDKMTIT